MIFICLGTQDLPFNRLLNEVENCIQNGVINEKVIAQVGCTKYKSDFIECFDYCSSEKMEQLIKEASLIITHGGTGTIVTALRNNKRVIAMNRLKKYGEHNDDHQKEIIEQFAETNYILSCYENENLADKIIESKDFEVTTFYSNTKNVLNYLREYINKQI